MLVEQLAAMFEEEPKRVAKVKGLLGALPTMQGGPAAGMKTGSLRKVAESVE